MVWRAAAGSEAPNILVCTGRGGVPERIAPRMARRGRRPRVARAPVSSDPRGTRTRSTFCRNSSRGRTRGTSRSAGRPGSAAAVPLGWVSDSGRRPPGEGAPPAGRPGTGQSFRARCPEAPPDPAVAGASARALSGWVRSASPGGGGASAEAPQIGDSSGRSVRSTARRAPGTRGHLPVRDLGGLDGVRPPGRGLCERFGPRPP
jgi:hypothetical protein